MPVASSQDRTPSQLVPLKPPFKLLLQPKASKIILLKDILELKCLKYLFTRENPNPFNESLLSNTDPELKIFPQNSGNDLEPVLIDHHQQVINEDTQRQQKYSGRGDSERKATNYPYVYIRNFLNNNVLSNQHKHNEDMRSLSKKNYNTNGSAENKKEIPTLKNDIKYLNHFNQVWKYMNPRTVKMYDDEKLKEILYVKSDAGKEFKNNINSESKEENILPTSNEKSNSILEKKLENIFQVLNLKKQVSDASFITFPREINSPQNRTVEFTVNNDFFEGTWTENSQNSKKTNQKVDKLLNKSWDYKNALSSIDGTELNGKGSATHLNTSFYKSPITHENYDWRKQPKENETQDTYGSVEKDNSSTEDRLNTLKNNLTSNLILTKFLLDDTNMAVNYTQQEMGTNVKHLEGFTEKPKKFSRVESISAFPLLELFNISVSEALQTKKVKNKTISQELLLTPTFTPHEYLTHSSTDMLKQTPENTSPDVHLKISKEEVLHNQNDFKEGLPNQKLTSRESFISSKTGVTKKDEALTGERNEATIPDTMPLRVNLLNSGADSNLEFWDKTLESKWKVKFNEIRRFQESEPSMKKEEGNKGYKISIFEEVEDNLRLSKIIQIDYIDTVKKNTPSMDFTINLVISTIPLAVEEYLQNDRTSSEELSTLFKTFGKYWTHILTLSTHTSPNMISLLKMKEEKDLQDVLKKFYSAEF